MAESRRDTFAVDARVSLAATVPLDESFRSTVWKGQYAVSKNSTRRASKWLAREYGEVFEESIKFGYFVRFGEEKALADVHFVGLEAPPLFGFLNARGDDLKGMHLGELNELEHKRFCSGGSSHVCDELSVQLYDAKRRRLKGGECVVTGREVVDCKSHTAIA